MAGLCFSTAKVCAIRATKLNGDCGCFVGEDAGIASSAVVRVNSVPIMLPAEEYLLESDTGGFCFTARESDMLTRMGLDMELCTRDIELICLMTGATAHYDGDLPVGFSRRPGNVRAPKIALEIWTRNAGADAVCVSNTAEEGEEFVTLSSQYTRVLWPHVELNLDAQTFANEVATVKIVGEAFTNPAYRNTGCWNDVPPSVALDLESPEHSFYDDIMPNLSCGYAGAPTPGPDDTAFLQALIDVGGDVSIPPGTYFTATSLYVDPGVKISLNGSTIRKSFIAANGQHSMFRNRDLTLAGNVDGFEIHGPGTIGATSQTTFGKILQLRGNDMWFEGFTIDTYGGGQAMYFGGDDVIVDNVTIQGSAPTSGTGGMRYVGGTGLRVTNCDVTCGDDAYQFVPANTPTDPFFGMATSDGEYKDCVGNSTFGRLVIALVDTNCTQPVENCRFINISGNATRRGIVMMSRGLAPGLLHDITITDVTCTMNTNAPSLDTFGEDILIRNVEDITFTRLTFNDAVNPWVHVDHNGAGPATGGSNILFDDCVFNAHNPLVTNIVRGVFTEIADNVVFQNCDFYGNGTQAVVHFGVGGDLTIDSSVLGCNFYNLGALTTGAVQFDKATNCTVDGSSFFGTIPGPGNGVKVTANGVGNFITNNDFSNLVGTAILDLGTTTTISGNITSLFVGHGAQQSASVGGGTLTPPWPVGYTAVAGHMGLVLMVGRPVSTNQPVVPGGWALGATHLVEGGANDLRLNVYWKVLTAAEAAPTFTTPLTPAWGGVAGGMMVATLVFQNIDPVTPFDVASVGSSGTATSFTPTGITTLNPFAVVVSYVASHAVNQLDINTANSFLATGIAGAPFDTGAGGDMSMAAAYRIVATPGPVTCPIWDEQVGGPSLWGGLTFALRRI